MSGRGRVCLQGACRARGVHRWRGSLGAPSCSSLGSVPAAPGPPPPPAAQQPKVHEDEDWNFFQMLCCQGGGTRGHGGQQQNYKSDFREMGGEVSTGARGGGGGWWIPALERALRCAADGISATEACWIPQPSPLGAASAAAKLEPFQLAPSCRL